MPKTAIGHAKFTEENITVDRWMSNNERKLLALPYRLVVPGVPRGTLVVPGVRFKRSCKQNLRGTAGHLLSAYESLLKMLPIASADNM